jgi:hypothetical protein
MRTFLAVVVVVFIVSPLARAQIIYEPVRYQYGDQRSFYYGGTDVGMLGHAERQRCYEVGSADRAPVYVDCYGYRDARVFRMGPDDAANEANASLPRYFRKRDLMNSARLEADGTVTVPSRPMVGDVMLVSTPSVAPKSPSSKGYILIVPRKSLQPKAKASDKVVASAD